jgi:hypothetical protein
MPLTHAAFSDWEPLALRREAIAEEELEGYRMWQEANGGYFG